MGLNGPRPGPDSARVRKILAELPLDISEPEGKVALQPTIREATEEIEQRQAEEQRGTRKTDFIQQGLNEVLSYLFKLKEEGEISEEDYWDSELTADLKEALRRGLESDLTADETTRTVREFTHKIIGCEIG